MVQRPTVPHLLIGSIWALSWLAALQPSFAEVGGQKSPHELLFGTLWMQTALEHDVTCTQTYRLARIQLAIALQDKSWTAALEQPYGYENLPPALILDIDETVLDNSAFQARLVEQGIDFNLDHWRRWVREEKAEPMPGVKAFLDYAMSINVPLFFVTNREFQLEDATVRNMRSVLEMDLTKDQVLCKMERPDWGSDKTSRRAFLAKSYRILLLVGDDFNDFAFLGKVPHQDRIKKGSRYQAWWGTKWIQLPNPLYGSWEKAVYDYNTTLTEAEKRRRQYGAMNTKEDAAGIPPVLRPHP